MSDRETSTREIPFPWGDYLEVRARMMHYWIEQEGKTPEDVVHLLRVDPGQVRLIVSNKAGRTIDERATAHRAAPSTAPVAKEDWRQRALKAEAALVRLTGAYGEAASVIEDAASALRAAPPPAPVAGTPVKLGCVHGRAPGMPCPHCLGVGWDGCTCLGGRLPPGAHDRTCPVALAWLGRSASRHANVSEAVETTPCPERCQLCRTSTCHQSIGHDATHCYHLCEPCAFMRGNLRGLAPPVEDGLTALCAAALRERDAAVVALAKEERKREGDVLHAHGMGQELDKETTR